MVKIFRAHFMKKSYKKTKQEIFRIEKVIRKRGNKYLVKWLGYPDSFNSCVDAEYCERI